MRIKIGFVRRKFSGALTSKLGSFAHEVETSGRRFWRGRETTAFNILTIRKEAVLRCFSNDQDLRINSLPVGFCYNFLEIKDFQ
jgi:hypothetical protein